MAWLGRGGGRRGEVDVERWPDPGGPADYLGALALSEEIDRAPRTVGVLQRWDAGMVVGVLWPAAAPDTGPPQLEAAFEADPLVEVVVRVGFHWTPWGPDLSVHNRAGGEGSARWVDVAGKLGVALPWWPFPLCHAELLLAWAPGTPPVLDLAAPILDVAPLLRAAVTFPDGHATRRTLIAFAQTLQHRGTDGARTEVELLRRESRHPGPDTLLVAAEPLDTPEVDIRYDLDEAVRRAGWLELLSRADALSEACVQRALYYDSGRDFPASYQAHLHGEPSRWAAEWTARLTPAPMTTAHRRLLRPGTAETTVTALVDPATDVPVIRSSDGALRLALPQRLPATTPFTEMILDEHLVWIRVEDGTLYPAPSAAGYGVSWGYAGGGPGALALLAHRLLVDVNAHGAEHPRGAPAGLEALFEQKLPTGTVLTRAQLEEARGGPYLGEN